MTVRQWISGASLAVLAAGSAPALAQTTSADRRVNVTPYLGVDQVVMAPLKGDGDVLTYTNVTAGVTAQVQTRRVEAAVDLQYNHSFSWSNQIGDQDVLSGIAVWRSVNGCAEEPDRTQSVGSSTCQIWSSCSAQKELSLCLHGGGHEIPNGWFAESMDWALSQND